MIRTLRTLYRLALAVTLIVGPLTAALGASVVYARLIRSYFAPSVAHINVMPRSSAASSLPPCNMPGLALPGEAPANSLAYFGQDRAAPDTSVTFFVGAYVKEAAASHLPEVTVSMLNPRFQLLQPGSDFGGTLS